MRDAQHAAARRAADERRPSGILHPSGKNFRGAGGIFAHQDDHGCRINLRPVFTYKNLLLLRVVAVALGSGDLFSAHSPFEQGFAVEEKSRHRFQRCPDSAAVPAKIQDQPRCCAQILERCLEVFDQRRLELVKANVSEAR